MSIKSIREAAERELAASEAEPEEDDENGEEEEAGEPAKPEPEPEDETPTDRDADSVLPEPVMGGPALDADQIAELTKAQQLYAKRVSKVFGDNQPPECPHCLGLGVDLTYGEGAPEYEDDPTTQVCPVCVGWGSVRTGSRVPDQSIGPCPRCKGAGYLKAREVPINDPAYAAPVMAALEQGTADPSQLMRVGPGEPGYETWMGDPAAGNSFAARQPTLAPR
jgi:hypothetical protein